MVVRQKGITLDVANNSIFTFEAMRAMVLNQKTIESAERFQFKTDPRTKDIITKYIKRSVKSTIGEKRVIDGFDTLPFGFEGKNKEMIKNKFYKYIKYLQDNDSTTREDV